MTRRNTAVRRATARRDPQLIRQLFLTEILTVFLVSAPLYAPVTADSWLLTSLASFSAVRLKVAFFSPFLTVTEDDLALTPSGNLSILTVTSSSVLGRSTVTSRSFESP